jgi:hypothetical protein
MKVMYILHSKIMGGATIAVIHLIEEIVKQGVEPIIVIPSNEKNVSEDAFRDALNGINCHIEKCTINSVTLPVEKSNILREMYWFARRIIYHRKSLKELNSLVTKYKPDIIHTNTGVVLEGYLVADKNRIPHIWHIREYQGIEHTLRWIPNKEQVCANFAHSYSICITHGIQKFYGLENNYKSCVISDPLFSRNSVKSTICNRKEYFLIANRL